MKKIILGVFIFNIVCTKVQSQTSLSSELPIISQKASEWCWAASLETVVKYFDISSNITQCSLAKYNRNGGYPKVCCSCTTNLSCLPCTNCGIESSKCNCCLYDSVHTNCNQSILNLTNYKKLIEKRTSLTCQISNTPLSLSLINDELNANRPVIIVYRRVEGFQHASVIFSTSQNNSSTLQFINIIDPKFKICIADTVQINYTTLNIERPTSAVYNLRNTQIIAMLDNQIIERQPLKPSIKTITKNFEGVTFNGGIYESLSKDSLQALIKFQKYYPIPVKYISEDSILKKSNEDLKIGNSTLPVQAIELVSNTTPKIITTFQLLDNKWVPIRISKYIDEIDFKYNIKDTIASLNNSGKSFDQFCNSGTFEHIKYLSLRYEFYRFCLNNNYYLIPLDNYPDIKLNGKSVEKNNFYSQKSILIQLKNNTLKYRNKLKKQLKNLKNG